MGEEPSKVPLKKLILSGIKESLEKNYPRDIIGIQKKRLELLYNHRII